MTSFDAGLTLVSGVAAAARRTADGALHACLIRGAPGSGKSTLAMQMIALGARLVADDAVGVSPCGATGDDDGPGLLLHAPNPPFAGLLHLRELGLMRLPLEPRAPLRFIVDITPASAPGAPPLAAPETANLAGIEIPLYAARTGPSLAAALFCLLDDASLIDPDTL